jgi:triacylglycerol lipase
MNSFKAVTCALLSRNIYQDFSNITFHAAPDAQVHLIDRQETDTQCVLLMDASTKSVIIVFRGSEQKKSDWETNLNFGLIEDREQIYPYTGQSNSNAKMHRGFARAYFSVRDEIHEYLKNNAIAQVTVTGHSLGGALATLCSVDIQYNFSNQVTVESYTYGAPKVGNSGFVESYNRRVPNTYRFVHGIDLVPGLPRFWQGYHHVAQKKWLPSTFSWRLFKDDHSINKYIHALKTLQEANKLN